MAQRRRGNMTDQWSTVQVSTSQRLLTLSSKNLGGGLLQIHRAGCYADRWRLRARGSSTRRLSGSARSVPQWGLFSNMYRNGFGLSSVGQVSLRSSHPRLFLTNHSPRAALTDLTRRCGPLQEGLDTKPKFSHSVPFVLIRSACAANVTDSRGPQGTAVNALNQKSAPL